MGAASFCDERSPSARVFPRHQTCEGGNDVSGRARQVALREVSPLRLRASLRVFGIERAEEEQFHDRPARLPRNPGSGGSSERDASPPVRDVSPAVATADAHCGGGRGSDAVVVDSGFAERGEPRDGASGRIGRFFGSTSDGAESGFWGGRRLAVCEYLRGPIGRRAVGVVRAIAPPGGDPEPAGAAALPGEEQEANADAVGAS